MSHEKNSNNRIVRVFTSTADDGTKQGLCIWEVAGALVSSSRDLGRLCSSQYINKWAKYKPLNGFTTKRLSASDRAGVNYGIENIPVYSSFGSMVLDVKEGKTIRAINSTQLAGKTPWNYTPPTAGPYRLLDFDGYYADADLFIRGVKCGNGYEIQPEEALQLTVDAPATNPGQIAPGDLSVYDGDGNKLTMSYYGIALYGKYLSGRGKTITNVINNPNGMNVSGFTYGSGDGQDTFYTFAFLSTGQKNTIDEETSGNYYVPILPSKTAHSRKFVEPRLNLAFPTNDMGTLKEGDNTGKHMYFLLSGRPNANGYSKKISDGVYSGYLKFTITNNLGPWAELTFYEICIPAPPMISETQQAYTIVYITIEIENGIPTIKLQTYFASDVDGYNKLEGYAGSTYVCSDYTGNITSGHGLFESPDGTVAKLQELSFEPNLFTKGGIGIGEPVSKVIIG